MVFLWTILIIFCCIIALIGGLSLMDLEREKVLFDYVIYACYFFIPAYALLAMFYNGDSEFYLLFKAIVVLDIFQSINGFTLSKVDTSKFAKFGTYLLIIQIGIAVICGISIFALRLPRAIWQIVDISFFLVKLLLFILARKTESKQYKNIGNNVR